MDGFVLDAPSTLEIGAEGHDDIPACDSLEEKDDRHHLDVDGGDGSSDGTWKEAAQHHQAVNDMVLQDTDESNQKVMKHEVLTDEQKTEVEELEFLDVISENTIQMTMCKMEAQEIINKCWSLPDDQERWAGAVEADFGTIFASFQR